MQHHLVALRETFNQTNKHRQVFTVCVCVVLSILDASPDLSVCVDASTEVIQEEGHHGVFPRAVLALSFIS